MVLNVPCHDAEIDIALQNLGETDMCKTQQYCFFIDSGIPELAVLNNRFIDIDELNYFAKRLDSFDRKELNQFKAAMQVTKPTELLDMINLTFNLHNYTLISDFSNAAAIGKTHRLNIEGAIPADLYDSFDYTSLGESLLASGNGTLTSYGVLFTNGIEMQEIYDGQVFPQFFYDNCSLCASIEYSGKEETLYMPCEDTAIHRAVSRLGADSIEDCSLIEIDSPNLFTSWLSIIQPDYDCSDIYEMNKLAAVITDFNSEDIEKLMAVSDFAGTSDFESAAVLAENLNIFEFAPNIGNTEELGAYLIRESGEYSYDEKLGDYYDYDAFGKDTAGIQEGEFTRNGYVGFKDDLRLDDILEEDSGLTMGGM